MVNRPVLVLNQSYEPLNVCRARRALMLVFAGKAEMLENGSGFVHAASQMFPLPSVIRMFYMIKRPRPKPKLNRIEVFKRDRYTCQYCGKESHQLTLDHIVPRHRGGEHTWENLVSACVVCNRRKAGKILEQAGMKLLKTPGPPRSNGYTYIPYYSLQNQQPWQKYLFR